MKKLKGFTLIELIVGMGIMVILLSFVMVPWISGIESFSTANLSQQSTSAFIETYSRIDKNVRIAKEVNPTLPAGISPTNYTAGANTLILKVYQTNHCDVYDYIVYTLKLDSATGLSDLHEIVIPTAKVTAAFPYTADSVPHNASDQVIMTNIDPIKSIFTGSGSTATVELETKQGKVPRTIVRQQTRIMESRNAI